METLQDRCSLCQVPLTNRDRNLISVSNFAYLCLPNRGCMMLGHCMIVPRDHYASMLQADDNTWTEVMVCSFLFLRS